MNLKFKPIRPASLIGLKQLILYISSSCKIEILHLIEFSFAQHRKEGTRAMICNNII
jgi:hypothetical protein